jgi:hypothetical protein
MKSDCSRVGSSLTVGHEHVATPTWLQKGAGQLSQS